LAFLWCGSLKNEKARFKSGHPLGDQPGRNPGKQTTNEREDKYHLQPAIALIDLPYYENMKLAKMDGWDLVNERGEPWPWPDLSPPVEVVRQSHLQAFVLAKEIELHHQGCARIGILFGGFGSNPCLKLTACVRCSSHG
jgi:hypothetical protein